MRDVDNFSNSSFEVNQGLNEVAKDTVNSICEKMLKVTVTEINSRLLADKEQFELWELSGFPEHATFPIYIAPDMTEAPTQGGPLQETLALLLVRDTPLFYDGPLPEDIGTVMKLSIPVSRNYEYPEPLDANIFSVEEPTEMYIQISPASDDEVTVPQRYLMRRDLMDPKGRFVVYEYTSDADEGQEEVVFDALSDREIERSMTTLISDQITVAGELLTMLGNYRVVPQHYANLPLDK